MADSFVDNYKAKHRHPLNKLSHSIGIPMIVVSRCFSSVGAGRWSCLSSAGRFNFSATR